MVRTNYSLEFKLRVINIYANAIPKVSLGHIERVTKVKRQVISGWIKSKDLIIGQASKRNRTRLPNKIQKCISHETEKRVKDWIILNRKDGACIDGSSIKSKAKEFYLEQHPLGSPNRKNFNASCGWLSNFCRRHNFSVRRITTSGRDLPHDTLDRMACFYTNIATELLKFDYAEAAILNMDESALYLDTPCNFFFKLLIKS